MMLITIVALFVTQAYWFNKSFDLQERQFDERINITLRNVADKLLKLDHDSISKIEPITKLSSNEFYVQTNCYYSIKSLDSLLKYEFSSRNIDIEYDYVILSTEIQELVLGNSVTYLFNANDFACIERADGKENVNFKLSLTNKTTYLINSMGIWMYSSMSLLALLAVFTFIVISIIKGKKLSLLKKDFVNNMTHELKTPIANISVASDAIRNRKIQMDDLKLQKYADIIYKENIRLHHLVDQVLQISAMEKEEESLSFEEVDIHEMIKNVVFSFEALIQESKGNINLDLEAENFHLKADELHISNVIYNLINNAIKYSNSSPDISIKTHSRKNGFVMEIRDKGIGVSKENQERIFDKFFRAETGNLHNTKGYGLGLSYVKLMVEKHNGSIKFKNNIDVGSTFIIFLPI